MRGIVALAVVAGLVSPWWPVVASSVGPKSSKFYIYRSVNNGDSWEASKIGPPPSTRVNALAVDATRSFAGTDEGVFVSSDGGSTWSRPAMGLSHRVRSLVVIHGAVYAGTDRGVYASRNQGRTWEVTVRGLTDLNVRSLATDGILVFAGTDSNGVFALATDGQWRRYGSGLPNHSQVFDLAATRSHLYAALYAKGLFRRSGNSEWEKIGEVKPLEVVARGDVILAGHNPGGIQQSADGGKTWRMATGWSGPAPIWVMGEAGAALFAGTSPGALARSEDSGASWRFAAVGMPSGAAVIAVTGNRSVVLAAITVQEN